MDCALRLALALSVSSLSALAQTPERDFAYTAFLLQQDDAYRAISQLKRLTFDHHGTEVADQANLLIGKLYADAKETQAAVYHFTLVADAGAPRWSVPARFFLMEQLCEVPSALKGCVDSLSRVADPWATGIPQYLSLYYRVLQGELLTEDTVHSVVPSLASYASMLVTASVDRQNLALKRPWLAGLLSVVIPGLGQLYVGRYLDALVSFLVTGALIAGTILLALPPVSSLAGSIALGVVAAGFYTGNIVNAVVDAQTLNEQRYADFHTHLQGELFPRMTAALEGTELTVGYKVGTHDAVVIHAP